MPRHSKSIRNGLETGHVLPQAKLARCRGWAEKLPALILDEARHLGNGVLAEHMMLTHHRAVSGVRPCQHPVDLTQPRNRLRMAEQEPLARRIVVNHRTPALSHEIGTVYVGH